MVLVELGSKAPSTGLGAMLLAPYTSTSSSGLVYAKKVPVKARVPELELPHHRWFRAANPDPA